MQHYKMGLAFASNQHLDDTSNMDIKEWSTTPTFLSALRVRSDNLQMLDIQQALHLYVR